MLSATPTLFPCALPPGGPRPAHARTTKEDVRRRRTGGTLERADVSNERSFAHIVEALVFSYVSVYAHAASLRRAAGWD